ncbi:SpoIIE family protein phosphatase [Terracidiphilus gabretensis]|uniref:SpoIIE family protein phosphatase n=1 Tax=Terracidiphilus gabretensis TaxID=1577687 RepID=UPI00071BFAE1|nr:SpoIIE family protein phosphatase [Terracidiphilus gabretensis]
MASSTHRPVLTYSNTEGSHSFPLNRHTVTIGRHADQDLVLADTFVSRRHAVIRETSAGYEIEDLDSSHGTYLNGTRIQSVVLRSGDVLQFGSPGAMKIRFHAFASNTEPFHLAIASDLLTTLGQISTRERTPAQEMGQLNFLLNAARKLNAGSATQDILHALLQISIQLTNVERGFAFLLDPDSGAAHHASLHLALGLSSTGEFLHEDSTISRSAIQQAVESSSKFTISDTWAAMQAAASDSILANSIRCIYCIPLRRRATGSEVPQLLGVLYLDSRASAGRLDTLDHELLDAISTEAANLLNNALLVENELKARKAAEELAIAARIHAGLMPANLPSIQYASLQARTIPCRDIGGDFYDAIPLPDSLGLVIADVSGKGVPASIVAATLQGIIHAQMLTGQPLAEIAALVNRFLTARSLEKYATLVLMKLYPDGLLEYINCGHIPPLHITATGAQPLPESNLVVGLIAEASYSSGQIRLAPNERILLSTDGIVEAENGVEEQFGDARFHSAAHLERIDAILHLVFEFQGSSPAQDDCTLLDVRYLG